MDHLAWHCLASVRTAAVPQHMSVAFDAAVSVMRDSMRNCTLPASFVYAAQTVSSSLENRDPQLSSSMRHLNTLKILDKWQPPSYKTKSHIQEYKMKKKSMQRQVT